METLPSGVRYRHWPAVGDTRAVIQLCHGLGEHSGRYNRFAEILNQRGFAVLAQDHIGHGESPGDRVFVKQFDDYLVGVRELRAVIEQTYPGVPCFLVGHSMGGLMAGRVLLEDQDKYRAALLSGPAFAATEPPSTMTLIIGRLLAKIAPKLGLLELDVSGVSRDPKVVADYNADPLVNHGKVSAALTVAIFDAMAYVLSHASKITLPLLVMHGGADTMAAPHGAEAFVAAVGSEDKRYTCLPGLYHEIFNEPEGVEVINTCGDWLESQLV